MSQVSIKITAVGPYHVKGDVEVVDADGKAFGLGGRSRIALCGCGASKNAPFCDGSHNKIDLESDRSARNLPSIR